MKRLFPWLAAGVMGMLVFSPVLVFSQESEVNINSASDVQRVMEKLLGYAFTFFWVLAVAMIIWAAYIFLVKSNSDEDIGKAKKILLYAIIAGVVALSANGIKALIVNILE